MPRLIKGASYNPATEDLHSLREEQHPCDVTDRDDSWEEAARTVRRTDPEGIESLKLLRWLQRQAARLGLKPRK